MRRRIGICVHQWHWLGDADPEAQQRAFETRMATVCRELLAEGDTDLIFLTTHQGVEGIHRDDDVSERICAQLPETLRPLTYVTHEFIHPREFAHIMGACDLAISSRLHGAIMSLVGGAPVIAFAYEPKTRGLMRQLDLEDCVLEMGEATAEEILAKARELLRDPAATRARFTAGVAQGRALAMRNRETLREALNRTSERMPPAQAA
jgi:colanic acid/amylovoran biosynthesis protein